MRATEAQRLRGEGRLPILIVFLMTVHCEEGLFLIPLWHTSCFWSYRDQSGDKGIGNEFKQGAFSCFSQGDFNANVTTDKFRGLDSIKLAVHEDCNVVSLLRK